MQETGKLQEDRNYLLGSGGMSTFLHPLVEAGSCSTWGVKHGLPVVAAGGAQGQRSTGAIWVLA